MYFLGSAFYPPLIPVLFVAVLVDVPLSAVADLALLPFDLAVRDPDARPWDAGEDCGLNFH
jgi:hypothetical protein